MVSRRLCPLPRSWWPVFRRALLACSTSACSSVHDGQTATGTVTACVVTDETCQTQGAVKYEGLIPCEFAGECHAVGCECKALTDTDCAGSKVCHDGGYFCGVFHNECYPVSRLGCTGEMCETWGLCDASSEICQVTDQSCANSKLCQSNGHCHRVVDWHYFGEASSGCYPTSAMDCQQSTRCRDFGYCEFFPELGICGPEGGYPSSP